MAGRDRALLIGPDNAAGGWVPLADVAPGRAFAVEVRPDVLAVDLDAEDAAAAVEVLAAEVVAAGAVPVVAASGQDGRRHLFARVPDAVARERLAERAVGLGADVRRVIRPPLSPHRLGLAVALLSPADPADALAALGTEHRFDSGPDDGLPVDRRPAAVRPERRLSARVYALLRHGDRAGRYRTGSEAVQAIATAAVNAGWSEEGLYAALVDPANIGGRPVQKRLAERGEAGARRWVRLTWEEARKYVDAHPAIRDRATAVEAIARVDAEADRCGWKGQAGTTDRKVLAAVLTVGQRVGSVEFKASVRQLAEDAGVTVNTVMRAMKRLQAGGWVERAAKGYEDRATRWRIVVEGPRNFATATTSPTGGVSLLSQSCALRGHDAWRWGGLGGSALLVWAALDAADGPLSVAALAVATGKARGTVRRCVARLAAARLAVRDDDGGWSPLARDLDDVAEEVGTAGRGERQRERHKAERDAYAARLAGRRRLDALLAERADAERDRLTPRLLALPDDDGRAPPPENLETEAVA